MCSPIPDQLEAWELSDQDSFLIYASHILAFVFVQLHQDEGYQLRYLKPHSNLPGHHVYVSDGVWAFDAEGWQLEEDLLEAHRTSWRLDLHYWDFDLPDIPAGLVDFCEQHHFRPPAYFLELRGSGPTPTSAGLWQLPR